MVRLSSLSSALGISLLAVVLVSACGDDEESSGGGKDGASGTAGDAGGEAGGSLGGSAPTGGDAGTAGTSGSGGSNAGGEGAGGSAAGGGDGGAGDGGTSGADAGGGTGGTASGGEGGDSGAGGEGGTPIPPLPPAPTFGPEETLATSGVGQIAVDMGVFGTAAVVWENNQSDQVVARVATNKAFGGPQQLDGSNGRPSVYPAAVAAIGASEFLAIWIENNDGFAAYARRYSGSWGTIQPLEEPTLFTTARLSVNDAGNGILGLELRNLYTGMDESATVRRVTSGTIGASEDLSLHQTSIAVETAVAPNGNAVIAWLEPEGLGFELWARRLDRTSGWATAERISTPATATLLHAAAFDDGSALVLWQETPTTARKLWESVYRPGSGWSSRGPGFETGQWVFPTLVGSRSGALIWVYNEVDGAVTPLRYRIRSALGVWSDAETLANNAPQWTTPAIAPYDQESYRLVYNRPDPMGMGYDLWTARYVAGHGFVNDEAIATPYYLQEFAKVAVDDTGRGIVIWRHRDQAVLNSVMSLHARWFE